MRVTPGINHQSRENKSISARAMGRSENYISKPSDYISKIGGLSTRRPVMLNTIIFTKHSNNCLCPVILVKCEAFECAAKLLFMGCQIAK
jgi:hypothetical protein